MALAASTDAIPSGLWLEPWAPGNSMPSGVALWDCCRERTPRARGGVGEAQGAYGGEDSEGSRWRRWRECPVARNASEEPAGDSRGPGTYGM